jgi:hypothetical protein
VPPDEPLDPLEPLEPLDPLEPLEPLDPLEPLEPSSPGFFAPGSGAGTVGFCDVVGSKISGFDDAEHAAMDAKTRPRPNDETTTKGFMKTSPEDGGVADAFDRVFVSAAMRIDADPGREAPRRRSLA